MTCHYQRHGACWGLHCEFGHFHVLYIRTVDNTHRLIEFRVIYGGKYKTVTVSSEREVLV